MSGALAERVFVHKFANLGFTHIEVLEHHPFGLEDAARYPLFTPELLALMRRLIPPERRAEVAIAVTVAARKPVLTGMP